MNPPSHAGAPRPAGQDSSDPAPSLAALMSDHAGELLQACTQFGLAFVLVRRGGKIVDASQHALALLGRTLDELRSLPDVSALLPPSERPKRMDYRQRRREKVDVTNVSSLEVLHRDGRRIPTEIVPLPLGDGDLTILALRDLSQLEARDQLIDCYAALCERMPIGVMIVDAVETPSGQRLRLWSANDAACLALGMDLKSRLGDTLLSIFPGQAHEEERQRVFSVLGTGRTLQLPDIVIGDRRAPEAVYRRVVVSLPGEALAMLIDDVTPSVREDNHRRALMERIVELGDSDRRGIALGIHDDPLQQIAAAALLIGQLRRRDLPPRSDWLADADTALHKAMDSLRHLVFELSPPELVESGLGTAISAAADYLFTDTDVWVQVDCPPGMMVPGVVGDTAFRIAAEALTNVRKHSEATRVTVTVYSESETIRIDVTDDGGGFPGASVPGHFGLGHMRDRAEALGGTCGVTSSASGTTVTAVLPLDGVPTPPPSQLVSTVKELDRERAAIRRERDNLRELIADLGQTAERSAGRLTAISGLGAAMGTGGEEFDVGSSALAACRFLGETVADGAAIRLWVKENSSLHRVASWHSDPSQLAHLNQHLFVDRTNDTSNAHMVFGSGQPVLIDKDRSTWLPGDGPAPPTGPIQIHSAILVPIHAAGVIVGVMTACRDQTPERLSEADLEYFAVLSDIVGAHLMLDPETSNEPSVRSAT